MSKLRVLDLFSGIGGFSLGLERTGGFETVAFCEIAPFPRLVLAKHWPGVPCYHDVRELTATRLAGDGIAVDVITGGFPCQDISPAGLRGGMGEGTRSGLWSEIARLTSELRPSYVIVENVANLLAGPSEQPGGWFGRVLGDLASIGYDAEWHCIPASAIGAPHRRDRVWIVAYPQSERSIEARANSERPKKRSSGGSEILADATGSKARAAKPSDSDCATRKERPIIVSSLRGRDGGLGGRDWDTEPSVRRVADGISANVDRVSALGNAVVPQIPELIGNAILASMQERVAA